MKTPCLRLAVALLGILLISPALTVAQGIGAFADVGFSASDEPGANNHFNFGALDLYANRRISEKTNVFFELVFENDGESFVVDVERYWIMREINPAFKVGAGRFHSPLGHWNRNYHHGVLIQNTVSRPAFLDFEDGAAAILPMHAIGLMATGDFGTGFSYQFNLANGNSYDTSGGGGTGEILLPNVDDTGDPKTAIGRLTFTLPDAPLTFGVFGLKNDLREASASGIAGVPAQADLAQIIVLGGDLYYDNETIDFLAEYYYVDSTDKTSGVIGADGAASAYYIQLGYRTSEVFKVTYRYEDLSLDANVGYFNILGTQAYSAHVGVVRYEVDDSSALMLEYRRVSSGNSSDISEFAANWSFMVF